MRKPLFAGNRALPEAADCNINVIRPYRVHMKIADEFCRNRIVLAATLPFEQPSGMGMNGGIHDALMLSDALELSLRAMMKQRCHAMPQQGGLRL